MSLHGGGGEIVPLPLYKHPGSTCRNPWRENTFRGTFRGCPICAYRTAVFRRTVLDGSGLLRLLPY